MNRIRVVYILAVILLSVGCKGIFQTIAAQHIWARWERIQSLSGYSLINPKGEIEPLFVHFQYKKRERFKINIKEPSQFMGSGFSFNRGFFRGYNKVSNTGLIVDGVPLLGERERKVMIRRVLSQHTGITTHKYLGKEFVAERKTEKYVIETTFPVERTHYLWIDRPYMMPLKTHYVEPYTGVAYGFEVKAVEYNKGISDLAFHFFVPEESRNISFDLKNLEPRLDPFYLSWELPEPFEYIGTVDDSEGSDWVFSDYSERPNIFYVMSSKKGIPKMPVEGMTHDIEIGGKVMKQFLLPSYGVLSFEHQGVHYLVVSNMKFYELVEVLEKFVAKPKT